MVDAGEAEAILMVLGDTSQKKILSLNTSGRVREFQLVRTFSFKVQANKPSAAPAPQVKYTDVPVVAPQRLEHRQMQRVDILPLGLRAAQAPREQPHGDLKTDCGECHSAERWTPVEVLGGAPDAPTNVSATAIDASATVTFSSPAYVGGGPVTGYTVASNPAGGVDSNAGSTSTTHVLSLIHI